METYSPFPTMEQSSLHSSALANSDGLAARSQRKREAEAYVQDFPRDNLAFDSDDIEVPCSPHATQPTQPTQIIRPSDKARPWRTCGSQPTLLADVHMTNSKETQPTQIVAQSCKAWLGTQPTEFLGTDCRQSQLFESLCLPSPSDTANPFFNESTTQLSWLSADRAQSTQPTYRQKQSTLIVEEMYDSDQAIDILNKATDVNSAIEIIEVPASSPFQKSSVISHAFEDKKLSINSQTKHIMPTNRSRIGDFPQRHPRPAPIFNDITTDDVFKDYLIDSTDGEDDSTTIPDIRPSSFVRKAKCQPISNHKNEVLLSSRLTGRLGKRKHGEISSQKAHSFDDIPNDLPHHLIEKVSRLVSGRFSAVDCRIALLESKNDVKRAAQLLKKRYVTPSRKIVTEITSSPKTDRKSQCFIENENENKVISYHKVPQESRLKVKREQLEMLESKRRSRRFGSSLRSSEETTRTVLATGSSNASGIWECLEVKRATHCSIASDSDNSNLSKSRRTLVRRHQLPRQSPQRISEVIHHLDSKSDTEPEALEYGPESESYTEKNSEMCASEEE